MATSNRNTRQSNAVKNELEVVEDKEFEAVIKCFLFTGIIFTRSKDQSILKKFIIICLDVMVNCLFVYFMVTSVFRAAIKTNNSPGHAFISGFKNFIGICLRLVILVKRPRILKCSTRIAKLAKDVWLTNECKSLRKYVWIGCGFSFLFPLFMNMGEMFIGGFNKNIRKYQTMYLFLKDPILESKPWLISLILFLRVANILMCNCFPLMVMVICTFVFTRIRDINLSFLENLQKSLDMNLPAKLFSDYTILYGKITNIIEKVEKTYSLISFFLYGYMLSSVFAITSKMVTTSSNSMNAASIIYQIASFFEIVVCFIFLSVRAASVNESAIEVKNVIHSLPAKRFDFSPNLTATLLQLANNFASEVCITGWGLFMINRGFILTTAGVVVTYGVILVQLGG
ncbi:gustatory receptor for sugar taste 64f-like [Parasteatoda tepidariorum]|uniref:gustatory receptor for sugar taste 64f-like n=1 Tax=Parasteatoda tepidariorum TaxID=114398 RepID=UPI0039BCAB2D